MKYIAAAYLVAALIGLYVLKHMPKEPMVPPGRDALLWNRGRRLYNYKCVTCHNSNPDLRGSVGPALRGVSEDLLRDRLKNGKGTMPAFPNLVRQAPAFREFLASETCGTAPVGSGQAQCGNKER